MDFTSCSRAIQHFLTGLCYYNSARKSGTYKRLAVHLSDAAASPRIKPTDGCILGSQKLFYLGVVQMADHAQDHYRSVAKNII